MVLHHVHDQEQAVLTCRGAPNPGGLLVIVETATRSSFLPEDIELGLQGRLTAAVTARATSERVVPLERIDGQLDAAIPALLPPVRA
jgi:hypothetical protein